MWCQLADLRQEIALFRQELLGMRWQFRQESEIGYTHLGGSLDTFHDHFTRRFAEVERKLVFRFGVMFFSGCALTVALMLSWR